VVGRAIAEQAPPISLSFWRWFLAVLILLPFIIKPIWQQRKLIREYFWTLVILSATGVSTFNTLAYIGLQYTTATNGTLLNSLIPIFIIILSRLIFQTQATKQQMAGILISFIGVLVILTELSLQNFFALSFNHGDLWILVAALDWALYSVLLKRYRPKNLTSMTFLGITVLMGWLLLLPLYLINPFKEASIVFNNDIMFTLAYIAVFPSIIAYLAWNYGINQVGANIGGQFIHLMPLFGAILAMLFLGESLYLYHLLGGVLIAIGLLLSLSFWPHKFSQNDSKKINE